MSILFNLKNMHNNAESSSVHISTEQLRKSVGDKCIDLEQTGPSSYGCSSEGKFATSSVYKPRFQQKNICICSGLHQSQHQQVHANITALKQAHYRKWQHQEEKKQAKNSGLIPLYTANGFSEGFQQRLGKANTTNIQNLDDEPLRTQVFAGCLEATAIRQAQEERNTVLLELINFSDRNICVYSRFVNGNLLWKIGFSEEKTGFIELIKHLFNIPFLDALATLSNILGMSYEKVFSSFDTHQVVETALTSRYVSDMTIKCCPLSSNTYLQQTYSIQIKGFSGQTIGGIALYECGGVNFFVPVSSAKGMLSIGRYQAKACWLNHDKIDSNRTAKILLCQSLHTALALQKIYENDSNIIVTAHFGEDLDCYSWNYFYGRTVILICAPDKHLLSRAGEYHKKLLEAKVGLCKIYPYPLLHFNNGTTVGVDISGLSELERELITESRYLDQEKSPDLLFRHIVEESLLFTDFCSWGQRLYLFKGQKSHDTKAITEVMFFSMENQSSSIPQRFVDVQLEDIFPADGVSLIHAPKNAGKSYCDLTVIRALSQGKAFMGIQNQEQEKRCLLLDTETLPQPLSSRFKQFGLDNVQGKTFFPISKLASSANREWASYDISNKEHQNMTTQLIQEHKINFFILDNITSGTKAGGAYIQATAGEIFEYSEILRKQRCGVILVHHTVLEKGQSSIDGKVRGSNEFSIRAHTEIILIGKEEILRSKDSIYPKNVLEYAHKQGATIGLYFKVCKKANILEQTILWAHLPQNASEWIILAHTDLEGNEVEDGLCDNSLAIQEEYVEELDVENELENDVNCLDEENIPTFEEKQIVELCKKQGAIKSTEIEKLLACKSSKAQGLLKGLCDKKLIRREGTGPATKYLLV